MPVILLERLPLPNLSTYVTFSVGLLACAVLFSHMDVTGHYEAQNRTTETDGSEEATPVTQPWDVYLMDVISVLFTETWCVWTLINMVYCCLILVGKTIQNFVFGELRVSEQEHLRDRFWNFVFYKFIFIFGVMNVQSMDDVLMWCAWFSILGFLQFLAQLCKDRFEYLTFSPMTSRWTHVRVVALLTVIWIISSCLLGLSIVVGFQVGWHTSAFMAAETILLILSTLFVIVKYGFHLWELRQDGLWEKRAVYIYYTELVYDLLRLSIDFTHHLHMLIWGNIFLSMANLVICMQLRYLFYEFQRRVQRHKNYLRIVSNMERLYPTVNADESGDNDQCAICWDSLNVARKLPCGHLFHNSCLRSWLEQDSTCPTCRCALTDPIHLVPRDPQEEGGEEHTEEPPAPAQPTRTTNHFFRFEGSRYVSWFPSFSVEVTHTRLTTPGGAVHNHVSDASHLSQLARQVQSVFPHMPLATLQEDLQMTHSADLTIDNILEGRLQAPPTSMYPPLTHADSSDLPPHTRPAPGPSSSAAAAMGGVGLEPRPRGGAAPHHGHAPSSSSSDHIGFIQDDNLANLGHDDDTRDRRINDGACFCSSDVKSPLSSSQHSFQFSKNPEERERMLAKRKKDLLAQAKSRFLARATPSGDDVTTTPVTVADDVTSSDVTSDRRELAYQAAVRRREIQRDS